MSQTHHAPHTGLPHSEPVHSAMKANMAPVGAVACAIIDTSRFPERVPTPAHSAMVKYKRIAIHVAGTWM